MSASAMSVGETYNARVVRQFAIMTVVWGIVGMLVGVVIAAQLYWPALLVVMIGLDVGLCGRVRPHRLRALQRWGARGMASNCARHALTRASAAASP